MLLPATVCTGCVENWCTRVTAQVKLRCITGSQNHLETKVWSLSKFHIYWKISYLLEDPIFMRLKSQNMCIILGRL